MIAGMIFGGEPIDGAQARPIRALRHARGDLLERDAVALTQRVRPALIAPTNFEQGLAAFSRKPPAEWLRR